MASLANEIRSIQAALIAAVTPALAHLSIRPQGVPTPCVVWDCSTEAPSDLNGSATDEARAFQVEVRCVADDAAAAAELAEKCVSVFEDGAVGGFILAGYEFQTGIAVPDDGQADAERVMVATIHLTTR